jgi:hypothetical protein
MVPLRGTACCASQSFIAANFSCAERLMFLALGFATTGELRQTNFERMATKPGS